MARGGLASSQGEAGRLGLAGVGGPGPGTLSEGCVALLGPIPWSPLLSAFAERGRPLTPGN